MNLRMVRSLQFELFNYFANYLREKRNERDFEEITKYIQQLPDDLLNDLFSWILVQNEHSNWLHWKDWRREKIVMYDEEAGFCMNINHIVSCFHPRKTSLWLDHWITIDLREFLDLIGEKNLLNLKKLRLSFIDEISPFEFQRLCGAVPNLRVLSLVGTTFEKLRSLDNISSLGLVELNLSRTNVKNRDIRSLLKQHAPLQQTLRVLQTEFTKLTLSIYVNILEYFLNLEELLMTKNSTLKLLKMLQPFVAARICLRNVIMGFDDFPITPSTFNSLFEILPNVSKIDMNIELPDSKLEDFIDIVKFDRLEELKLIMRSISFYTFLPALLSVSENLKILHLVQVSFFDHHTTDDKSYVAIANLKFPNLRHLYIMDTILPINSYPIPSKMIVALLGVVPNVVNLTLFCQSLTNDLIIDIFSSNKLANVEFLKMRDHGFLRSYGLLFLLNKTNLRELFLIKLVNAEMDGFDLKSIFNHVKADISNEWIIQNLVEHKLWIKKGK